MAVVVVAVVAAEKRKRPLGMCVTHFQIRINLICKSTMHIHTSNEFVNIFTNSCRLIIHEILNSRNHSPPRLLFIVADVCWRQNIYITSQHHWNTLSMNDAMMARNEIQINPINTSFILYLLYPPPPTVAQSMWPNYNIPGYNYPADCCSFITNNRYRLFARNYIKCKII